MTYTGAPCGVHLSAFDVDRSSDSNGERRSAYTPKVVRRWEIGAPKRFGCADFMESSDDVTLILDRPKPSELHHRLGARVNATLVVSVRIFRRGW